MNLRVSSLILFSSLIYVTSLAQDLYNPALQLTKDEDGTCTVLAYFGNVYTYEDVEVNIYVGEDPEVELHTIQYVVKNKYSSKWAKINRQSTCLSADPNDCLTSFRNKSYYGPFIHEIKILKNQNQDVEKRYKTVTLPTLIEERTALKEIEVLCPEDLTRKAELKILKKLGEDGFLTTAHGLPNKGITELDDPLAKKAFYRYQMYYGLPMGYLDKETLKKLGL